jgi:hypothetical protein
MEAVERETPATGTATATTTARHVPVGLLEGAGTRTFEAVTARLAAPVPAPTPDAGATVGDSVGAAARDDATPSRRVRVPAPSAAVPRRWRPGRGRPPVAGRARTLSAGGVVDRLPSTDGSGAD